MAEVMIETQYPVHLRPREVQSFGNVRDRCRRHEPELALDGVQDEQQRARHVHVFVQNVAQLFGHGRRLNLA